MSAKSKTVFKSKWFTIKEKKYKLPSKKDIIYFEIVRKPAVFIIPFDNKKKKIYLIKQYRFPVGRYSLELPAGLVNPKESFKKSAERELKEEAGLSGKLKEIGSFYLLPSCSSQKAKIFLATDLKPTVKKPDDSELITQIKPYSIYEIKNLIKTNKIINGPTLAVLGIFLNNNL